MINMLQVTAQHPLKGIELWADVMEIPSAVNNLNEFLIVAKNDFPDRKVRIIQIVES